MPRLLKALALTSLLGLLGAGAAAAQELRPVQPIPTPARGAAPGVPFRPVSRRAIEDGIRAIYDAWNTPLLRDYLSSTFYDRTRLTDELAVRLPRDARVRVLGIESVITSAQRTLPGARPETAELVTTVVAVVRSQTEFEDPVLGFQRQEGLNEVTLELRQAVPR